MNSTNCIKNKTQRRQRGLTLIELVVVLAILVALAGLIIGNFPSLFRKATRAVGANSIQDIARAVQFQATVRNNFGSDYDNLTTTAGTALSTYLAQGTLTTTQLSISSALTAAEVGVLTNLGLTRVILPVASLTDNITWDAYPSTATTAAVDTSLKVAQLDKTIADAQFNSSFDKYFVFGVGNRCTLVGADRSLLEAPTRSSAVNGNDPKTTYQRYGVVFGVTTTSGTPRAVFVGAVGLDSTGISRTDSEIKDYNAN